jgi:hypothetical protein
MPGTPKTGTVPVNPGGAESVDADGPETCGEPDSEVPAVPGPEVEGERDGTPCEEPVLAAPALATT